MAVKINNTATIRKAQRWDERDDAALCILLKRKIKDVTIALRESETPYERGRLKEQKKHYKHMLGKVESGVYNGDIIFGELQAASALRSEQAMRTAELATVNGGKKYNNSYVNMDFDYESALRKKRYYGFGLPLILLLFSIIFIGIFIMGAFLPSNVSDVLGDNSVSLDSFFVYKLGPDFDIIITNDGNWPGGKYADKTKAPKQELPWVDAKGATPETVALFADIGMTAVNITPFDIVKAWFRTPMLKNTRIDFLEDSKYFEGDSIYYKCFLEGTKGEALLIQRDADGKYDFSVIMRHIGTYGTIIFLIAAFLFGLISVIINICRLFTYTSRRFHIITILSFVFSILCLVAPAFATVDGTEIGESFKNYFLSLTNFKKFMTAEDSTASVGIGLIFFVPLIINLLMLVFPKLFRNRLKKRVSYIPRGNKNRNAYNDPFYAEEDTLRKLV